jgi:hypothetical protein
MKADRQATLDRHFLDYRSFITPDSREILYDDDWKARVEELRVRCEGHCEHINRWDDGDWERCPLPAQDPHHVIRRSVKRDDRLSNLQALCRYHHDLLDERKPHWTAR